MPALSSVWRKVSAADSCSARAIRSCARNRPFWKRGCVSDATADQMKLLGLVMAAPALLVQPAVPLSVMEG